MADRFGDRTVKGSSSAAKHVHHLAVEIGPRPPASSSEAVAARYCAEVLEQVGYQTRTEPFGGPRTFSDIYIPIVAALFGGTLMGTRKKPSRLLGSAISAAALAAYVGENTGRWRPVSRSLSRKASQNILAVATSTSAPVARLVLTAHVDSSRSGLAFSPKNAPEFRGNVLKGTWAAIAATAAWLMPRALRRSICAIAAPVLGTTLGLLIEREARGIDVDGANDDASGVGVLLAVAEELAAQPLANTEVWFLVTGCEESGLIGMQAFLERHSNELEDACFVGLDSVAGPETSLKVITRSGMLSPVEAGHTLVRLAGSVADDAPALEASSGEWRTAGLDTDAAALQGFEVMSIMALTNQGTLPNWHWPTDTYDNLDEAALDRCFEFTMRLLK
ncbi:MAG: M28 family metallopeptidase, partial [Actinobacteria bacterium]|nr:M28 family metallopeptidase [Actinomycetota bacterium]